MEFKPFEKGDGNDGKPDAFRISKLQRSPKRLIQNGQNSVVGSEATTGGMSGIVRKLLTSGTGNGDQNFDS